MNHVLCAALLSACGGHVAPGDPPPAGLDGGPGCYERDVVAAIVPEPPGESSVVELSCDDGDTFAGGGCETGVGVVLVQNESTGRGWVCAARATDGNARLRVWISCCR